MTKILVSYRRSDSSATAGRIYDHLLGQFGADSVFMDVDAIPFGTDFRNHIKKELLKSDVLLAIIGREWLGAQPDGTRRVDDEADPVRVEVETALKNGIPVLPVLIDGAPMPGASQMPDGLRDLAFLNAAPVDMGRDFRTHMERLARAVERILAERRESAAPAAQVAVAAPPPPAPAAPQRSGTSTPLVMGVAGILVAVLAAGGWYVWSGSQSPKTVTASAVPSTAPPAPSPAPALPPVAAAPVVAAPIAPSPVSPATPPVPVAPVVAAAPPAPALPPSAPAPVDAAPPVPSPAPQPPPVQVAAPPPAVVAPTPPSPAPNPLPTAPPPTASAEPTGASPLGTAFPRGADAPKRTTEPSAGPRLGQAFPQATPVVRRSPRHGAFVWHELWTTDTAAAQAFYRGVMGWSAKTVGQGNAAYTTLSAGPALVAGLATLPATSIAQGARPSWFGYVAVTDVDASTAEAKAAGATLYLGPADIPGIGRYALIADPQGASIVLFRPSADYDPPAATIGHAGWRELQTSDREAASAFYGKLLGWVRKPAEGAWVSSDLLTRGSAEIGSLRSTSSGQASAWTYSFEVDGLEAAMARVKAGGGTLVDQPRQMAGGFWTIRCLDPQGAPFALMSRGR